MSFLPAEIIKRKRNAEALSESEIRFFIEGYTSGTVPDYQMSALLMAIFFRGLTEEETLSLTKSMLHSGLTVDFTDIPVFKVDKHSTGGVGDKTSLILGPIVAAAGLAVPMISGRGLGHTGGTLDKLESIPGFNTQLSLNQFKEQIRKNKICFIGQTKEICPADKKIYALRDVTATVESLPLICASIMSKKLAEGIDGLVLDVKFGSGAFMKTPTEAEELALRLMGLAKGHGKKVSALITNMDQPLGRYAGNSLEIEECVAILRGETCKNSLGLDLYEDTRELSLQLSAHMLWLGEKAASPEDGYGLAKSILDSGQALEKFEELCDLQGGRLKDLPRPQHKIDILSEQDGFVAKMETEKIGIVGIKMKAGRSLTTDIIEPTAGMEFHRKVGMPIEKGQPLVTLYGANRSLLDRASDEMKSLILISEGKPQPPTLIRKVL